MKKLLSLALIILSQYADTSAQTVYKDFIIADKYIWALTSEGKIKLFDIVDGKAADKEIFNSSGISVIGKDANGMPVIVDSADKIKRYNTERKSWDSIGNLPGQLYGIVFNSKNLCYAITENGIINTKTKQLYFPNYDAGAFSMTKWRAPVYMIDKDDKIWLGFGCGEWGGAIYEFDTRQEKYIRVVFNSKFSLLPIKSIFEDSSAVYFTSSLEHQNGLCGSILKYENQRFSEVFKSERVYKNDGWSMELEKEGEYIGPGAYNSFDHSIYFHSQHGIFKGEIAKGLSKIENWKNIIQPVKGTKLAIIDRTKFAILIEKYGIGIGLYDGNKMIIIQ